MVSVIVRLQLRALHVAFAVQAAGAARMKGAARRRLDGVWNITAEREGSSPLLGVRDGYGIEQRVRVRMKWLIHEVGRLCKLHDTSQVHDCDPMTDKSHHVEVV